MTTLIHPLFAAGALQFAFEKATIEGKITIGALFLLSLFSWTIIITKFRQLYIARRAAKKFFVAYGTTRDPLDIKKRGDEFDGAPAYQLYDRGADELAYHVKNNPVELKNAGVQSTKISPASFEAVKVVLEEAAAAQAMSLEKGMIVLSTAVAGGPFIGLLGTVWGVMETFAGHCPGESGQPDCDGSRRRGRADRHGLWGYSSPSRRCLPTTSWLRPSEISRRNWTVLLPVTPTKSNITMWTTATSRTRSLAH
ncbi:MAG: MotA/TolQ/ExbB proton channel family protein [Limisphaerales bacterium]